MMHHLFQLFVALIMSLLATPLCAATQLPGEKIPRIGYLLDGSPGDAVSLSVHEAFEQGLRDLGWVVGKNIAIEYRYAEGKEECAIAAGDLHPAFLTRSKSLGNVEPETILGYRTVFPQDLIRHAEKLLVVRDGIASFFYHPFLVPPDSPFYLADVVQGLKKLGYQFVSAEAMLPKDEPTRDKTDQDKGKK
jgi:hypothetical protein